MPGGSNELMTDYLVRVVGNTQEERWQYILRAPSAKAALELHISNTGDRPCVIMDTSTGEVLERYLLKSKK